MIPKECKGKKFLLIILSFFISLENIVLAIFTSRAIRYLIQHEIKKLLLLSLMTIASLGSILFLKFYFQDLKNRSISYISNKSRKEIYNYQMNDIKSELPISFYINDIKFLEENLYTKIFEQYINIFSVILSVILSLFLGFIPTVVIVALASASTYVPKLFQAKLNIMSKRFIEEGENYTIVLKDIINGRNTIKNHHAEDFFSEKQERASNLLEESNIKMKNLQKTAHFITFSISQSSIITMIIVSSYFVLKRKMDVGNIIGIIQISNSIIFPVIAYLQNKAIISSTKETLEKQSRYRDAVLITDTSAGNFDLLEFRNVRYKIDDHVILDNVDLSIRKGDKILVTGASGSGKSTFLSVFSGANNVDLEGKVLLDRKDMNYRDLKNHATTIMQDVFVFSDTLFNNVVLGKDHSKKDFLSALNDSQLEDLIRRFDDDEIIQENGKSLSGGQKQRIEIARSLVKDKQILIIDEGFSSLDIETADKIESNILKDDDLTVLHVTHHINEKRYEKYDKIFDVKNNTIQVKEIR